MKIRRLHTGKIAWSAALILCSVGLSTGTWAGKDCGDGQCGRGENANNCPSDCAAPSDGGNDSGTDLGLSCILLDDPGDNVLSDKDDAYVNGVDKVDCSTGGTTQPNLSGIKLDAQKKGKFRPGDRFVDLAFTECAETDCYQIADDTNEDGILDDGLPGRIFEANGDNLGEQLWIAVRPYRDGGDHIQNLSPGEFGMAVRINLKQVEQGTPRVVINLAAREIRGDKFQGTLCDLGANTADTLSTDALVIVDAGPENRFVVTTVDGVNDDPGTGDGGFMRAAICSDIPPDDPADCEGADDTGLCNFHGFVNVRFTMVADELP